MNPINDAGYFLISTLFDLYLFILMLRMILALSGVHYLNPLTQFVIKLTQPLINPLRRILPTVRGIELSTLFCLFILECIKFLLLSLMSKGLPNPAGLLILAFADLIKLGLMIFFYAILAGALLTWVNVQHPIVAVLDQITAPILRPIQRILPPIGGFDLSPIPALIGIQLIIILIVSPLLWLGMSMS